MNYFLNMKNVEFILKVVKNFIEIRPELEYIIYNCYFKSIFYRKRHIKRGMFDWIKDVKIFNLNKKEGELIYNNFKFILLKNKLKDIPLHQKYLYTALISYFKIPKYYLLFWDDLIVFKEIFIEKIYDKMNFIKKGDVILDIGASIGWYTCKIAKLVGDTGKIIAIEPNPENFFYLKKNIKLNDLKNIITLNLGVWSSKNNIDFMKNKYASSLNYLHESKNDEINRNNIKIKVDIIDNIIMDLNLKSINLIRMDIEGAEVEAIKGSKKTLLSSNELRLIISAYHKTQFGRTTYETLVPYLEKLKFKIFKDNQPYIYAQKIS